MNEEIEHTQGLALDIRVTFEGRQGCRDYVGRPLHQSLLQTVGPFIEGIVLVDDPSTGL